MNKLYCLPLGETMKEMMPFSIAALALAAIFAAEVSTADTVLFMLSTSISKDLYKTFFNTGATDEELLAFSRKATIVCGILGIIVAHFMSNIITALSIFYSLMTVSLAAPFLFGLFSDRASTKGAFCSAGIGVLLTLILQFSNGGKGFWILNATSTGILAAIIVMFVSLHAECAFLFFTTNKLHTG